MRELRELFLVVVIGAWLVLTLGAAILGLSVGLAIGVMRRSWIILILGGLFGLCAGVASGTIYFWQYASFPIIDGSRGLGIWTVSWQIGLWLGVSGIALLAIVSILRLTLDIWRNAR